MEPTPPTVTAVAPPAPEERRRLARDHFTVLGDLLNERTFVHILALGIADGWRCWEAGDRGASVPLWLSERVGPHGRVLASDLDTSALDGTDNPPFEVRRHDLTRDPPPEGEFDLVHARLVLEHLSDPAVALATLVAGLRPGGWLLVERSDPMLQPLACPDETGPRHALANKIRTAVWTAMTSRTNLSLRRTLSRRLRGAGLTDVAAEVTFTVGGPAARHMQRTLVTRARPALIAAGSATAEEIDQHLADLNCASLDIAVFPIVSAWGHKPRRRAGPTRHPQEHHGAHLNQGGARMNRHIVRLLYELLSRIGANPSLTGADVPDSWLVEHVEGEHALQPGRALDLGCGAGRNTRYLARQGWDATGIDMIGRAIALARSRPGGEAAKVRFLQGDVTRLDELDIGDGYDLIVDSGCYYGLSNGQRHPYAEGVTRVAAPDALLLMAGFTNVPAIIPGISEQDLHRRFPAWTLRTSTMVPIEEIARTTRIPLPLKAALRSGRLRILRFELLRQSTDPSD
jgi:SAM-dependent methyltransferase